MIRHSVFFWLDSSVTDEQKLQFEGGLSALFDIDVIQRGHYGKPAATPERPVTQNDYDYALFLDFASIEDHNIYQDHADHHLFVNNFKAWFETVKVFDCDIAD